MRSPPKASRKVLGRDEDEIVLPVLYRSGSIYHKFRDALISVAEIKPTLVTSAVLDCVASAEEVDGWDHSLFSA